LNDPTARLSALAQEVAADPASPRYPELASSLLDLGRYIEAAEVCERGLARAPSPLARVVLAEARLLLGQRAAAEEAARAALEAAPDDPKALRILGACHLDHGRIDDARAALERSATLDPSDMQTLDLLARVPEEATVVAKEAPWATGTLEADAPSPPPGLSDAEESSPWIPPTLPAHPPPNPGVLPDFDLSPAPAPADDAALFDLDPLPAPPSGSPGKPAPSFELDSLPGDPAGAPGFELDDHPAAPGPDASPFALEAPPPEAAGGGGTPYELDLPSPEETEPPPPPAVPEDDAPLELDLPGGSEGGSRQPSPPGEPPRPPDAGPPSDGPARRPTRPPSNPLASPPARPARPPRRPLDPALIRLGLMATGGLVVVVVIAMAISSMQKNRRQDAYDTAMASARAALARDLASGYEEAEGHLAEALRAAPRDPAALGLAAFAATRLHTAFGAGTDALVRAEDHLAVAEPLPELAPEAAAARGLLHLEAGRLAEAVSTVTRTLVDAPNHAALLWVRAQAEVRLEREDMAIESLRLARRSDPTFVPAASTLADLLAAQGEPEEAAAIRLAILENHPGHAQSLVGLLQGARDGHAEPEAVLGRILETRDGWAERVSPPELCRLHLDTAKVAVLAGRAGLATESEDLAPVAGADDGCRIDLARHLSRRHRPAAALAAWQGVRDVSAVADARAGTARAALAAGRPERVLEILPASPTDPIEQALRARAALWLGRGPEALSLAEAATADPGRAPVEAWAVLSTVLAEAGDGPGARRAAQRTRGAGTEAHEALVAAEALLQAGDTRNALRILEAAAQRAEVADYAVLVAAGRLLAGARREPAALARLEAAIALNPEAEPAVEAYLDLAPPDRASRFLSERPAPWGPALEGLALAAAGRHEEAAARLEAARGGATAWARHLDAVVHHARGPIDLAVLRANVAADADRILPRVLLADALLVLGRLDEALEVLETGLRRAPGHPRLEARAAEAMALSAATPPAAVVRARGAADRAGAGPIDGATRARVHAAWALACASAGDGACARQQMNLGRRTAPDDGRVLLLSGRTLETLGDGRAAQATYRLAGARPGGEEGLLRLGLLESGDAAAETLRTFLERAPGHALAGRARDALTGGN
jgi:tetratricopeptide (TPR) repeat protein